MKLIYALLAAACVVATPAAANPPEKEQRVEKRESERSPYSNRVQAKKRLIRDAIREARKEDKGVYRFRRAQKTDPD